MTFFSTRETIPISPRSQTLQQLTDFTNMGSPGVTIAGQPFDHKLLSLPACLSAFLTTKAIV
jgi:hypothetical protein